MQMIKVDGMIILATGDPDQLGLPPIVLIHSMHIMTSYMEAEESFMLSYSLNLRLCPAPKISGEFAAFQRRQHSVR